MLTAYPTTLNFEAVATLGKAAALAAQGKLDQVDGASAVHSAWDVLGYGLSVWKPDPTVLMSVGPLTSNDYDKVAKACENHSNTNSGVFAVDFPWSTVLAVAIQIIQWFLTKQ